MRLRFSFRLNFKLTENTSLGFFSAIVFSFQVRSFLICSDAICVIPQIRGSAEGAGVSVSFSSGILMGEAVFSFGSCPASFEVTENPLVGISRHNYFFFQK